MPQARRRRRPLPVRALLALERRELLTVASSAVVGAWALAYDPNLARPAGALAKLSYGLDNATPGPNGGDPVDINGTEALALIGTNRPSTLVAVLDSGIDATHPDLAANLWTNPGEVPGDGVDNDGDGYVDDVHGWNTAENSSDVADDVGHGTFVAGIIAASAGSSSGLIGVDPLAKVLAVKVGRGGPTLTGVVDGIEYAIKMGAKVINMSLTMGTEDLPALDAALQDARAAGVVVVAAAGNDGTDAQTVYPADAGLLAGDDGSIVGARLGNVLSVGAVGPDGKLADFSNTGVATVDVAAPGVGIWSTIPFGSTTAWRYAGDDEFRGSLGYAQSSGTSFAAPYVAGVASLLFSQDPARTAEQVVGLIKSTATPVLGLGGTSATGGVVDAFAALGGVETSPPVTSNPAATPTPAVPVGPIVLQYKYATHHHHKASHAGAATRHHHHAVAGHRVALASTTGPQSARYRRSRGDR